MPQPVAEIERAPAIVARQQVARVIEIGNVARLVAEPALIEPRHVVGGVELDLAEGFGKRDLLLVVQRLIAEDQYRVAVHGGVDRGCRAGIERYPQINAGDLGDEFVSDRDEPHEGLLTGATVANVSWRRHPVFTSPNRSRLLPASVTLSSVRTLAIARFGWGEVGPRQRSGRGGAAYQPTLPRCHPTRDRLRRSDPPLAATPYTR